MKNAPSLPNIPRPQCSLFDNCSHVWGGGKEKKDEEGPRSMMISTLRLRSFIFQPLLLQVCVEGRSYAEDSFPLFSMGEKITFSLPPFLFVGLGIVTVSLTTSNQIRYDGQKTIEALVAVTCAVFVPIARLTRPSAVFRRGKKVGGISPLFLDVILSTCPLLGARKEGGMRK